MKIVAWNLAHQIKEKPIPDFMLDVVRDLEADTVLVNEYVDATISNLRPRAAPAGCSADLSGYASWA